VSETDKQLSAATDVAKATRWAMWAAVAAAMEGSQLAHLGA